MQTLINITIHFIVVTIHLKVLFSLKILTMKYEFHKRQKQSLELGIYSGKTFCFLCVGGIICVTINKDEYIFVFVLEHFESFFESLLTRNTPCIKFSHISFCATHTMLLLFLISTQFSFHFF